MVVGGCPVRIPDHATQIATMALDLLHQSGKFKLRHLPKTQLRLRIGLHTGKCHIMPNSSYFQVQFNRLFSYFHLSIEVHVVPELWA